LVLIAAAGAVGLGSRAYPDTKAVFESAVDETMAVRFYYDRGSDYYHFPLVLRATGAGDPRLDTIAPGDEGRTAYISAAEVQRLLQELAGSDLGWRESEKVQRLESFKQLVYHGRATQSMEVLVVCSKETVSGQIRPKRSATRSNRWTPP